MAIARVVWWCHAWLLAIALAGCAVHPGDATEPGVPAQLQGRQVIVTLAPAPPERWAAIRALLSRRYDIRDVGAFPLESLGVQCAVFQVPADRTVQDVMARLAADPLVETVQPNLMFDSLATSDDPYEAMQYGVRAVRADAAHHLVTGKGVRVAVVDTGVDATHPDLRARVAKTASFVQGGVETFTEDSHGTAVAGVIAAAAGNGIGIVGIAPDAQIVAAKACWHRRPQDLAAVCSSWTLAKAVDYAVRSDIRVLNLSLGGPPDALLERLIAQAVDRGITVVAAVADRGPSAPGFPASLDLVIAVLASDRDGGVRMPPSMSRTGALAAPGIDVLTTAPHGSYDFRSGSSLAAAHVSGIAALLLERDPSLKPAQVRALLAETARPADASAGVRRVDACAALAKLIGAPACPLP